MPALCVKLGMRVKYGRSRQDFRFWDVEATFLGKDVNSSEAIEIDKTSCLYN